jgi:hypothetical protein
MNGTFKINTFGKCKNVKMSQFPEYRTCKPVGVTYFAVRQNSTHFCLGLVPFGSIDGTY